MKNFLVKNWLTLVGVVVGAGSGFAYWFFIGCTSGNCPITSSPLISSVWGAGIGGLIFSMIKVTKK